MKLLKISWKVDFNETQKDVKLQDDKKPNYFLHFISKKIKQIKIKYDTFLTIYIG